jgi:hypothetical protein
LRERLLHAAHRTPASHDADAAALSRMAEGLHYVMTEEIGEQNDELRARSRPLM